MFTRNEEWAYNKGYRISKEGILTNSKGQILKPWKTKNGYNTFNCYAGYLNGKKQSNKLRISRFQAFFKFGDKIYKEGIVVRHLNAIRTDDRWDNIEIGTQSDNLMDIPKEIRLKKSIIAARSKAKYDVIKVRKYHEEHKSYKKTMEKFNMSNPSTLHNIITREHKYPWIK